MSRDVLTVDSTMRIPLLYQGEYSQWVERLPNDIYSLIDSNKTVKDLWDALARHMLGSKYGEQDRKAVVLKEKVVVSLNSKESDADDFSEIKKITALLAKAFNRRKFYSKPTNNNLQTSFASQSANKKQEYVKSDDKKVEKKDDEKKQDMSKVKCYNCKKEGYFAKDCKKAKVKDYEYYKTKMLLAKKDKNEQVLLAEDHEWIESSSDLEQEINANMVFMARIKKVLLDSKASSSFADDKIFEVSYYQSESQSESEYETLEYYDNTTTYEFNKIDSLFQQTSSLKPYVPNLILEKIIIDLEDEVVSLLDKEKENLKTIESLKLKDVEKGVIEKVYDSEETPNVIALGMFKLSVSQSVSPISVTKTSCASNSVEIKANLSSVNHSNLNKNVKRYSYKNLMACNNSDTRSAFDYNNARNALCNARINASVDVNDLFVCNDVSIRKSHVSKMPFRKKPNASLNVPSRSKLNKSLPRIMHKWFPKLKSLAEPERFALETMFVVIAGYEDVVIGSMKIKKVYYVEDFLIGDRPSNFYTIALNEIEPNSSNCLLAKASSSQSWLWLQRLSHLNFTTINNLVKNNLVRGLRKMKFEKDHLCSACEQRKIHQKYHKSEMDFASNKPFYLLHMDLCGPMCIESINGK
nr:hypothetical protein [Tanacetum cinerariifolium]